MSEQRIVLVIFPAQGQINPALQFAKRVISMGARVTLPIPLHLHRRIASKTSIPGLSLAPFSDGYDEGFNPVDADDSALTLHATQLQQRASDFISHLILSSAKEGNPFTCFLHTLLIPWAPQLARRFNFPSAMLWIQPATVLNILYHYFHGYADHINDKSKSKTSAILLPGFSFSLSPRDIPSSLLQREPALSSFLFTLFKEQIHQLDLDPNPIVLVNTFEALEEEALSGVDKLNMIPIGPFIPSAFLDGKDPRDTSFGADIFPVSSDCVEWLDSKQEN
ncbi:crocetin glucosyltransferase, chloroplastic-like [Cajanus cajan]|uniref:crocetin glucosyltransferase, chloroplastic-like n=1 Tax=Cajanus cajan TaxID=3821 RepID=UPI00098DB26A|nr:crocetin glucosyltransferase, chloroplastic-like [Cajanus cajan]